MREANDPCTSAPSDPKMLALVIAMMVWSRQIHRALPSAGDRNSIAYARELIGLYHLIENVAVAKVAYSYPEHHTPALRRELVAFIRRLAARSLAPIAVGDVLIKHELMLFRQYYWQWIDQNGEIQILQTPRTIEDTYLSIQELRAFEFASIALAGIPTPTETRGSERVKRISMATVFCAASWIARDTSQEALKLTWNILDPLLDAICSACHCALRPRFEDRVRPHLRQEGF